MKLLIFHKNWEEPTFHVEASTEHDFKSTILKFSVCRTEITIGILIQYLIMEIGSSCGKYNFKKWYQYGSQKSRNWSQESESAVRIKCQKQVKKRYPPLKSTLKSQSESNLELRFEARKQQSKSDKGIPLQN